jgi:hydroxylamine reductase (hybrid-cluster protein)
MKIYTQISLGMGRPKGVQLRLSPSLLVKQSQGVVCLACERPRMKECANKGEAFISKFTFSNMKNVNFVVLKVMIFIIDTHCI